MPGTRSIQAGETAEVHQFSPHTKFQPILYYILLSKRTPQTTSEKERFRRQSCGRPNTVRNHYNRSQA